MDVNIEVGHLENYIPPVFDEDFGYIVAKGFNENGIRVEFYSGEDKGTFLHKNAIFTYVGDLYD